MKKFLGKLKNFILSLRNKLGIKKFIAVCVAIILVILMLFSCGGKKNAQKSYVSADAYMGNIVETVEQILNDKKREMALDAPLVPSIVVKNAIENQVREIKDVISPAPVTSQLDGVRVKLNYDQYADTIANVIIDGKKLSELAEIKKSFMYDYILVKINSESSLVEDSN